ncbi:MAG: SpoIIE family protein phosphatase [Candidatus Rifleibacteriota bacterium]
MTETGKSNSGLKIWLKIVLTIFLPPMILLGLGYGYLADLRLSQAQREFERQAGRKLEQMGISAQTEKFICEEFNEVFDSTAAVPDLFKTARKTADKNGLSARVVVWNRKGEVEFSDIDLKSWGGDWKQAYHDLNDFNQKKYGSESKVPVEVYENLRRIFGPQFFPRYFYRCYRGNELQLLRSDSAKVKPLLWLKVSRKKGLAVFLDYSVLNGYPGLNAFLKNKDASGFKLAAIENEKVLAADSEIVDLLTRFKFELKDNFTGISSIPGYYVVSHSISDDLTGFCLGEKAELQKSLLSSRIRLAFVLGAFVIMILMATSFRVMVLQRKFTVFLRSQLVLLFIFSNALPGYVIGVISYDYLQQYREGLLNQAYTSGMDYLDDIDGLFENEFSFQLNRLEKSLQLIEKRLKKRGIDGVAIREFMANQEPKPYRLFLVGSATAMVASNEAVMKGGKIVDLIDPDHLRGPHKKQQIEALEKIGKFFLALLNHKPISSKMGTEVEMLTEALSQQDPVEMMQEFLHRDGGFWNWGIGSKKHPTFIRMIKLFFENAYDYLFIYLWTDYDLQQNFMLRSFTRFSRNEEGIRILAINDSDTRAWPPELLAHEKLRAFAERLKQQSTRELEYCNWEDQEYLMVGLKCNRLTHFRLIGLLPLEKIDRQVGKTGQLLAGLGLLSILVTMSLGLFVAGSIIEPLNELQKGIDALQKREFSYRLPEIGHDEFGRLASIFNTTLVDLEEMHTAAMFKEKIFGNSGVTEKIGSYEIFGQTSSFSDTGSDYLEIIKDGDKVRIMVGDVAGSGIAATLILAFFKSALMQLEHLLSTPDRLVLELDRLLKAGSKKNQRRFMAFQYLLLNENCDFIPLVNAGLFFPIVFDCSSRSIRQIELPSVPLGTGTSSRREISNVKLAAGEALVLFSNGVLAGGRINYEEIFAILLESDYFSAENLAVSFMKIFSQRFAKILNDDLTIVVIKKNEVEGIQNGTEPARA